MAELPNQRPQTDQDDDDDEKMLSITIRPESNSDFSERSKVNIQSIFQQYPTLDQTHLSQQQQTTRSFKNSHRKHRQLYSILQQKQQLKKRYEMIYEEERSRYEQLCNIYHCYLLLHYFRCKDCGELKRMIEERQLDDNLDVPGVTPGVGFNTL